LSALKCGPYTCLMNGRMCCLLYLPCQGQDGHQLAPQKIWHFVITQPTYINVCRLCNVHCFCQILTTVSMCQQILVQILGVKFHRNVRWKLHCSIWMDRKKPVAICFVNVPSSSVPDIRCTHNASWCSKCWMSGTVNGHLMSSKFQSPAHHTGHLIPAPKG